MNIDSKWNTEDELPNEGTSQGICPNGWHIPIKSEWTALFDNIDYSAQQSKGFTSWKNATNESGFSAVRSGRCENGKLHNLNIASFWSRTVNISADGIMPYHWSINVSSASLQIGFRSEGLSLRCIKNYEVE